MPSVEMTGWNSFVKKFDYPVRVSSLSQHFEHVFVVLNARLLRNHVQKCWGVEQNIKQVHLNYELPQDNTNFTLKVRVSPKNQQNVWKARVVCTKRHFYGCRSHHFSSKLLIFAQVDNYKALGNNFWYFSSEIRVASSLLEK